VEDAGKLDTAALFRRYLAFVSHFVLRMGAPVSEVDDIAQEVFEIAHKKGGYLPGPMSPKTWLARIALGVVSTHRRSRARRREVIDADAGVTVRAELADPARAVEIGQALERVQRALDHLDLDQRAIFVLYELSGESCDQIAQAIGVPVGTVYSRLHTARRTFQAAHRRLSAGDDQIARAPRGVGVENGV
jgi:RNA polymerase sigma-70 factor, ECF subfamily